MGNESELGYLRRINSTLREQNRRLRFAVELLSPQSDIKGDMRRLGLGEALEEAERRRMLQFAEWRNQGLTLQNIADRVELTRERVRQILTKAKNRGIEVQETAAAMETRRQERHGLVMAERRRREELKPKCAAPECGRPLRPRKGSRWFDSPFCSRCRYHYDVEFREFHQKVCMDNHYRHMEDPAYCQQFRENQRLYYRDRKNSERRTDIATEER